MRKNRHRDERMKDMANRDSVISLSRYFSHIACRSTKDLYIVNLINSAYLRRYTSPKRDKTKFSSEIFSSE